MYTYMCIHTSIYIHKHTSDFNVCLSHLAVLPSNARTLPRVARPLLLPSPTRRASRHTCEPAASLRKAKWALPSADLILPVWSSAIECFCQSLIFFVSARNSILFKMPRDSLQVVSGRKGDA